MSAITDARSAVTRSAGSFARIERPRPAKVARALLWLAIDRAADTRSVSGAARQWRRSVSVTICRASLALLVVWVFVVVWPGAPHMAGEADPRPLWAAAPVIAYLLSGGLVIDQFGARYGAAALFGLHLGGVVGFLPVMWAIALANPSLDATRFGQSTMALAAAWPVEFIGLVLLSYALAWLVPGSLPRQFRFTREAWGIVRDVDSARPHRPLPLTEARSEASVGAWE
ncbi:MAG TPA: hypothetical protein VF362_03685 [Demequinaceae bacterium]